MDSMNWGSEMAAIGFPDATNTGVSAGVTLTPYNGNLVISTPGAAIEGLDIRGSVIIAADNVTLKNCKVTSSAFSVVSINADVTGVVIEDCEINGLGTTSNARGIGGQGTFLRNNIFNVENGINVEGSNTLIQDNYIHDLKAPGSPRYDGVQIMGGFSNITIRENTVINSYGGSAVRISNDYGGVNGVVVDNNKLSGGDFIVYFDEKSSNLGQLTGVQFTNNYLDKGYQGYAFVANNSVDWQGNIDLDTGWAVAQDGTLTQPAEITVLGNGANIVDGGTSSSSADFTDFGSVSQGGAAVARTFTVRNDGGSTLTLGTPILPAGFSLGNPLVSSLAPGASDTFTVQLDTTNTSTGTKSGQISFSNNDSDESPFNFSITGTVNAVAPGAPVGFPDATNTGVSAGVTLTPYNGNLVISTPGAAIEGLDIRGSVIIAADNVTLKNCKVTSSAFSVVSINADVTGVVIEDCEINGLGTTSNARGIGGQGTFLRNNIFNVENGINVEGSNTLIQDNYIHDLKAPGSPRYDGVQIMGGFSNITIRENTVINSYGGSAVRISNDYGGVNGVVVDNNKLSGGDFIVYFDEKSSNLGQLTGVQFTNNYLDKGYQGYAFVANNSVDWQGNIDLDTGWAVAQDGTLTQPAEITVLGNGANIVDGGTSSSSADFTDFGSVSQGGAAVARTFTVRNDGGSTLTLGTPILPAGFSLGNPLVSSLAPGASDTFTVQLDTTNTSTGTKSGQISFSNNDSDESPFNFSITGTVNAVATPEITVLGNGANIVDGDTSSSSADFTDFGSVSQGGAAVVRTFTVRNDGGSTLTLGTPILPAGFSLGNPLVSSLAPGVSDTFTVQLDTTNTSTGTKSGQINFSNNDSDESPFNFSITGTVNAVATPEITVLGNGANIVDGGTSSSSADFTDFGSVSQGGAAVARTFTVRNDGGSTLTLGTPILPAGFSLGNPLVSSLAPGASDTFTVQLDTTNTSTGTKSGQINFSNNDSDESPFNFSITGTVNAVATPEITVLGNGANIVDGGTSSSSADFTDFGSVSQGGAAVARTFTVRNDGGSTLTLGTPILPAGFSLGNPLVSSLAPGASDTFTVQLDTTNTSTGTKSGQISFSNNDSDESPFNFSITGTVNSGSTSLYATPANFASQVAAATAGQVIYLASGDYGTWNGTNKAITIAKQSGATVTMGINFASGDGGFAIDGLTIQGGNIYSGARGITFTNCAFTEITVIDGVTNSDILFDHCTFNNINTETGRPAGRISLPYSQDQHSGVTVQYCLFDGGNSDGVQSGSGINILNNEFRNIRESGPGDPAHSDSIQLIGAKGSVVRGNYVHDNSSGIVAFDGSAQLLIEDNVVVRSGVNSFVFGGNSASVFQHNTIISADINLTSKSGQTTTNVTLRDNIARSLYTSNGVGGNATFSVNTKNMFQSGASGQNFSGTPIFVGGSNPTSYAGYQLATGSPGENAGSDGYDVGGQVNLYPSMTYLAPAGVAGDAINLGLTNPADQVGAVSVTIVGVPFGWTMSAGTDKGDGTWSVQTNDVSALSIATPVDFAGAISLQMSQTWTDSTGGIGLVMIVDNVESYAPGAPIFAISGDDNLSGSSGDDLFVLAQPIGRDTMHNFDVAHDKVDLIGFSDLSSFVDFQTRLSDNSDGDAVITIAEGRSITFAGVSAASLTADNFAFNLDTVMDNANSIVVGDSAMLPLAGTVENSGTIELASIGGQTTLQVLANGLILEGGGYLELSDSTGNLIVGTTSEATLTNVDNTISGAGQLGEGQLTLHNEGAIIASGTNALTIETGANAVVNSGTLGATGSGGLNIQSDIANSGLLWANGGDITIDGDVTGTGSAHIDGEATFEMGGAFAQNVTLDAGASATLKIDHAKDFTGTVAGFDANDVLDLADIGFGTNTTLVYAEDSQGTGGTLTVSDGMHVATIALFGQFEAAGFQGASDACTGTLVTYIDNRAESSVTTPLTKPYS